MADQSRGSTGFFSFLKTLRICQRPVASLLLFLLRRSENRPPPGVVSGDWDPAHCAANSECTNHSPAPPPPHPNPLERMLDSV